MLPIVPCCLLLHATYCYILPIVIFKGNHLSTRELEEMGRKFCDALLRVKSRHVKGAPPASALSQQLPSISDSLTHFDDGDG